MKNILCIIAIAFLVGCASGGSSMSPTAPPENPQASLSSVENQSNHAIWGWATLACDTQTGKAELIPSRDTELHLNVIQPIMASLGMGLETLPGGDPSNGLFYLDISFTNPFAGKKAIFGDSMSRGF